MLFIIGVSFKALGLPSHNQNQEAVSSIANELSLESAIAQAQNNDDWLKKSRLIESRFERLSEGASAMPDPTISVGLLNLPTNGFAFDQEPMTQLKLSASQMFPRGDTLALKEQRYRMSATEQPYLRENRRQHIALQATTLWLQAFEASTNYRLVNDAKPLFNKLGDIVAASYASSVGKANQQDIIRAELELVKLNDRLIALESQKQVAVAKLSQFLYTSDANATFGQSWLSNKHNIQLPEHMPSITPHQNKALHKVIATSPHEYYRLVHQHPLMLASEQRVRTTAVDIDIAKQDYKAQYGINASYAMRDDTPEGQSRADFFSIGVSVSVPLFSSSAQDAHVSAAKLHTEAIRTEKRLLMKELMASLQSAYVEYIGLRERAQVYQHQILPQIQQQAQAALNAYTNDSGDFAEVVRAKIDELDTQITMLNIRVKQRVALSKMDYFLASTAHTEVAEYE
ncbi:TolC family protein [Glaciecola petra]|uniref:TolC family protein n=1 Tax=Glaciecola petra TaxID=3075602 RepID=A0ABU2ZSY5_9ALTE|nr:TolC family protein [Aestuariibacter sp. P117]MDT0594664.1 TolC family protein [Aestuariibacter sp. P117]